MGQIDLSQFTMTFEETFRGQLDVTPWGPSKWIAHTPWNGDFGGAAFANPTPDFPFKTGPDGLTITARRNADGRWESGLLASADPQGRGFTQAGGYFEARMKLPGGYGVWPAFWLDAPGDAHSSLELDVIEYYGENDDRYWSYVHVWPRSNQVQAVHNGTMYTAAVNPKIYESYHTYGVEVTPQVVIFYFDRMEYWRQPAPPSASQPLMILVNLAMNHDKDLSRSPSPSVLHVDYIRAYKRR